MKRIYIAAFFVLFLSAYGKGQVPPAVNQLVRQEGVSEEQLALIVEKVEGFPDHTQLSLAFITDSLVTFYGMKRQNDTLFTVENYDSAFETGSITKVFTATLLANAVLEGKVRLEEPVNSHLPFRLNDDIRITFKALANHTSGLPRLPSNMLLSALFNRNNPYKKYSEKKLRKYMSRKAKLSGERYAYSNLGAGLLGYTLSQVWNRSYPALLKEEIFLKYGMDYSSAIRSEVADKLVKGLDKEGKETANWDLASLQAAGAVISTAEDLAKFALAQFDEANQELALTRAKTLDINEEMSVALGWHILKAESGDVWHWHNGGTGGYSSSMAIDTRNKTGIIILSNVSASNEMRPHIDELCFGLMESLEQE